ncbi:ATP-dependent zinc protease [Aestuariivivens sediminis]|uniref:ATP-dependent zinc protease family protein n=1 Tax=Aestuariivivens sediminis TaxID=2913557 RepID=UPI001F58F2FC|nr:RimK/LysX family protein [Aestuariivivens sediminis]
MSKKIIGRVDKVDFPKLGLYHIDVKMDTGAYTSAIHCSEIIKENDTLRCIFNSAVHQNFGKTEIVFHNYRHTNVKSSNGYKENRYKVKSEVIFFGKTYKINLTLSTRDDMKFPVLIGRQFLKQKFLVDVDLENVSHLSRQYEYSHPF